MTINDDSEAPLDAEPGPRREDPDDSRGDGAAPESEQAYDALPDPDAGGDGPTAGAPMPDAFDGWPYTDRRTFPEEAPLGGLPENARDYSPDAVDGEETRGDMGFFDHLEELRSRIIKALVGLVLAAILAAVYSDFIIVEILLRPAREVGVPLQNFSVMGQFTLTLQVSLISGLIISIPWILWQFWQFIKPGLYQKERTYSSLIAIATIFCFLAGVAFAYFVMVPSSLGFAKGVVYQGIENRWALSEYFSFILGLILACGVVFEMPTLSFALGRFGILTPAFMRHYRRHAIVVILIAAAVITPTTDPISLMMLAVPLYVLFEISILVAAVASRKREEAYADLFTEEDIMNTHTPE